MPPSGGYPGPPPMAPASWPRLCATSMLQGSISRTCSSTGPVSTMSSLRSPVTRPNGRRALSLVETGRGEQADGRRSEEHTSELQSLAYLVCRLLLEKKKKKIKKKQIKKT